MIRFNEQRFRFVMESPQGPVGRHLGRVGAKCESVAKVIVTEEGLVRSGVYRSSIGWRPGIDARGQFVRFGSASPIARLIEFGSSPHVIQAQRRVVNFLGNITRPGQEGGLWWTQKPNVGGRDWFVPDHPLRAVNHPGTKAHMVLHRAVRRVLRGGIA